MALPVSGECVELIDVGCNNCPPLVVARRGYTPARPSWIKCREKHLGAAYVLLTEVRQSYAHRLGAIGHLFEAEDESQQWPELHAAIRQARKHCQAAEEMPDWDMLEGMVSEVREQARETHV